MPDSRGDGVPIKVWLVCPGLGRIARGYETFTRECYEALRSDARLDVHLFKGAGDETGKERVLWNLHRRGLPARGLARLLPHDSYYVEQVSAGLATLPHLLRLGPDVIFYSDSALTGPLRLWRRLARRTYRLLLSNGGPVGPPFPPCEHIHQVLPDGVDVAVKAGVPPERQTFIPYGFDVPADFTALSDADRAALRGRLGLPADRTVLLSVGGVNASHKRMDYVIREVAALPAPRPYLLLLGNIEHESPSVIALGNELLGGDGFRAATVPKSEIAGYYRAADAFVLASLHEGFGRVYAEALSHGLPCLAHDYDASRYVLGAHGLLGDFRKEGTLAGLLRGLRPGGEAERPARHRDAYERFSWDRLRDPYVEMIRRCALGPITP